MLDHYYRFPKTVDRIRESWLADPIEQYVGWMSARCFTHSSVTSRVSVIVRFGEFTKRRGAKGLEELPGYINGFTRREVRNRARPCSSQKTKQVYISDLRRPIEQMLRVVSQQQETTLEPLAKWAPRFFNYLYEERGLREATVTLYRSHLARFEEYLSKCGIDDPVLLCPTVIDSFLVERSRRLRSESLRSSCSALRLLFRYMFREGILKKDISDVVEGPRTYRLSGVPRSIQWKDVQRTIECVDRRSATGKRDYAILLLLAVYGMRARDVVALTLDDIDWRNTTMHLRGRKIGNTTAYPLAPEVGEALLDYIQNGRPETKDRRIFMVCKAPRRPINHRIVALRATHYLKAAGVIGHRLGSHTLRHSVAQRLVDADFSLKVVGDYLGHRSPSSTKIYSKVSIEALREVALGDGEAVL